MQFAVAVYPDYQLKQLEEHDHGCCNKIETVLFDAASVEDEHGVNGNEDTLLQDKDDSFHNSKAIVVLGYMEDVVEDYWSIEEIFCD